MERGLIVYLGRKTHTDVVSVVMSAIHSFLSTIVYIDNITELTHYSITLTRSIKAKKHNIHLHYDSGPGIGSLDYELGEFHYLHAFSFKIFYVPDN